MSTIHDALKKVQESLDKNYGRTTKKPSATVKSPAAPKSTPIYAASIPTEDVPKRPPMKPLFFMWCALLILAGAVLVLALKVLDKNEPITTNPSPLVAQRLNQRQNQIAAHQQPAASHPTSSTTARSATVTQAPKPSAPSASESPADPQELILNGTMLMGNERVALINDDVYSLGDLVEEQEIIAINLKEVTLRSADGSIRTLKSSNRR